jgi:hypothetical protein
MFPSGSEDARHAAQWGRLIGFWHDLGKFAPEWQEYLRQKCDPHADGVTGRIDSFPKPSLAPFCPSAMKDWAYSPHESDQFPR